MLIEKVKCVKSTIGSTLTSLKIYTYIECQEKIEDDQSRCLSVWTLVTVTHLMAPIHV